MNGSERRALRAPRATRSSRAVALHPRARRGLRHDQAGDLPGRSHARAACGGTGASAWAEAANGALAAIVTAATAAGSRRRKRRLGRTWRKWSLVMGQPSPAVGAACEDPGSLLSLDRRAGVGCRTGTPLPGGSSRGESGSAAATFKVCRDESRYSPAVRVDFVHRRAAFPHHAAGPVPPLEAAERQYAERARGVPNWQPEDGDFA